MRAQGPRLTTLSLAAGASALILGYLGYRALPESLDAGTALYRSVQLFFLDYQGPDTGIPWELEVARFLAAAVVVVTVLGVVFTLAREQAQRLRIRFWGRRHVVVAGLGNRGSKIARRLRESGRNVAVIERDSSSGQNPAARALRIPVFFGDARSAAILHEVGIDAASDFVVVAGDDSIALEVLAASHRALAGASQARTTAHVAIDDLALWHQLHRLSLVREQPLPRVEFVSIPDRIAEELVSAASAAVPSDGAKDRLLVHGCGPTAVRTVIHSLRRSLLAGNPSTVVLVGPQADSVHEALAEVAPWASEVAEIKVERRGALRFEPPCPTVAFVCGFTEAEALAAGVAIAAELDQYGTQVFVGVPDQDTADALSATELRFPALKLVATETEVLGPGLFESTARELIARAKHEDYVLHEQMRGVGVAENPSMIPWSQLPESLRESNRRFAESVGNKLGELGGALVPLTGPLPTNGMPLDPDQLETLAEHEHERWVRDLEADGWRFTTGAKDPHKKLHPLLTPWSELGDEEREKDRDAIRALPKALATVGYALEVSVSEKEAA